jgi:hypothetical protein
MPSRTKQIENLLVSQALFEDIPKDKILLYRWTNEAMRKACERGDDPVHTCGSTACFGSWIALHPHFRKQGVQVSEIDGSPYILDDKGCRIAGTDLSMHLFGHYKMFNGSHWATDYGASDRDEVFARIRKALDKHAEHM